MKQMSEYNVGESLESIKFEPVTRLDLIKYAGASGDYNPIHTIDDQARKAGLPGIIAHGMLTMGRMSKLFTPYLEEGYIKEFSTRFSGMVFLDDVITLRAQIKEKEADYSLFKVEAVNQRGDTVAKGNVRFHQYPKS
jgi:acyl dehydratase